MILQLTFFLASLTTLAIIHIVATRFFLYWKYLWFDMPVHLLGGVCVALGVSILPFFRIYILERFKSPLPYIVGALMVGILWEIFEVVSGIMVIDETFLSDTAMDLFMDVVGGLLGYGVVRIFRNL